MKHAVFMRWCTGALAAALSTSAALMAGCSAPPPSGWSGYVEGEYVYVASPFGGALVELPVRRGEQVAKGKPLFTLDASSERLAREEAAARLASAAAQSANADKGRRREEISVTQAQWAQAQAQQKLAAAELARAQPLVQQGFLSPSALDDARTALVQAEARVSELSAALNVARLPAREDERRAAAAQAQAALQALNQSQWREQQKQQLAPADARVSDTFFRVGEWVNAGQPVVALLAPGGAKARFFVPERQLATLAIGQAVSIHCDGCGAPIAARIDFIASQAEYTPPVIYSNSQRAKLVFMVEARPQPQDGARLKPGQPIDVRPAVAS